MLEFIEGNVVYSEDNYCIIFAGGFGIRVETPYRVESGHQKLFTYLAFKEDTFKIYGFKTKEERDIFIKLTNINGIGTKNAFSIISTLSVEEFIDAVENSDVLKLTSVQGIGKKTANRIILELKGKLGSFDDEKLTEVLEALKELGFDKKHAMPIVREAIKNISDIQDIIKYCLQKLTEKR